MASIVVPEAYPWTLLSATAVPFVVSQVLGGRVMGARSKFAVPYPNLYAVPGVHEKADAFNRVQRGHQNMLETLPSVIAMVLVAGLKYPRIAAGASVAYCAGSYFYQTGYADESKDVKGARYTHPLAALKPIGMLTSFIGCITVCVKMLM